MDCHVQVILSSSFKKVFGATLPLCSLMEIKEKGFNRIKNRVPLFNTICPELIYLSSVNISTCTI